jgi:hypothetical protein
MDIQILLTNYMKQSPSWQAERDPQQDKKFSAYIETEGSLPYSQDVASGPYPDADKSSSQLRALVP